MASLTQLPSGKWRIQVRRAGVYRAATFDSARDAKDWASRIEGQLQHVSAGDYMPVPKTATLADLIDKYQELTPAGGKSKTAMLAMLKRELGSLRLTALSAVVLRDHIERRKQDGAGGVTIAADLSTLSAVLHFGRHARKLDLPHRLAQEARAALKYSGLNPRSVERDREPTDKEMETLYAYWLAAGRELDMITICRFALATGMRQAEICGLLVDDVDAATRTVLIRDRKDPRKKNGNNQVVPLLADAWTMVQPRLDGRAGLNVFEAKPKAVSKAFATACTKLGIKDLRFHDLRHRATAQFFRMGLDIPRVALLTGHKTWAMLKRYTDIKPADVHLAVAAHGRITEPRPVEKEGTQMSELRVRSHVSKQV